ncbi:putative carboxylic ester hydrolase [Saccharomycopsis crataegensis]|uniref:Lysophospholipase n=1 Tax=Saccharomycopsis crataegensis TaxID=43959 RepID=A0AAV5QQ63_9ASCO|nr:putative carboxylic ester hydrolase [Saccharomycopsis crataegensis]
MSRKQEYISNRQRITGEAHKNFIHRADLGEDFDADSFYETLTKNVTIAISISGGGYRSMFNGAGALMAFDSRTPNSTNTGHLGGILQAAMYLSGVSGGSWLVSSVVAHDFKSIYVLWNNPSCWKFDRPLLEGIPHIDFSAEQEAFNNRGGPKFAKRELSIEHNDHYENALIKRKIAGFINDKLKRFIKRLEKLSKDGNDENHTHQRVLEYKQHEKIDLMNNTFYYSKFDAKCCNATSSNVTKAFSPSNKGIKSFKNQTSLRNKYFGSRGLFSKGEVTWDTISSFYQNLHSQVTIKKLAGFGITFTDYLAIALTKRLYLSSSGRLPDVSLEIPLTYSSTKTLESFKSYEMPLPIILSNSRWPDVIATNQNSQILEFTPFEFGSWDYYLNAFTDIEYLGSPVFNGSPVFYNQQNQPLCVSGFDNIGFITATSSSLFNNVLIYIWQAVTSAKKKTSVAMSVILYTFGLGKNFERISKNHPDYAILAPNPFYGFTSSNSDEDFVKSPNLFMVDGGEDKQNIPFYPYLQEARNVDIIFAIDSTSDMRGFPNGTSLKATFDRYAKNTNMPAFAYKHSPESKLYYHSVFPNVPSSTELVSKGLNKMPSFMGCHLQDYPERKNPTFQRDLHENHTSNLWLPPLIVYFPNSPYSFQSNISTFKLSYSPEEVSGMLTNGVNIVTYGNSSYIPYYDKCIACATLKREFDRGSLGMNRKINPYTFSIPKVCQKCFKEFCYS